MKSTFDSLKNFPIKIIFTLLLLSATLTASVYDNDFFIHEEINTNQISTGSDEPSSYENQIKLYNLYNQSINPDLYSINSSVYTQINPKSRIALQVISGTAALGLSYFAGYKMAKNECDKSDDGQCGLAALPAIAAAPLFAGISIYASGILYDDSIESSLGGSIAGAYAGFVIGELISTPFIFTNNGPEIFFLSVSCGTLLVSILTFNSTIVKKNVGAAVVSENGDYYIPLPFITIAPAKDINRKISIEGNIYINLYSARF
jgi:hypothetical protein